MKTQWHDPHLTEHISQNNVTIHISQNCGVPSTQGILHGFFFFHAFSLTKKQSPSLIIEHTSLVLPSLFTSASAGTQLPFAKQDLVENDTTRKLHVQEFISSSVLSTVWLVV